MAATAPARKKSWREMTDRNSEWLTADDLRELNEGRDTTLRVLRYEQGKIKQSGKRVVALYFEETPGLNARQKAILAKPLGMNATNDLSVEDLYGTDKPDDWIEQKILLTLHIGRDKDPRRPGTMCDCVRIRPRKPRPDAQLGPGPKTFDLESLIADVNCATSVAEVESLKPKGVPKTLSEDDRARLKQAFADRIEGLTAEAAIAARETEAQEPLE